MKKLNDTLPKLVDSGVSEVKYDKDSLLETLTEDVRKPTKTWKDFFLFPYLNLIRFVLLVTVTIVAITFVLTFTFVYFKDVLLFRSNLTVNNQGVFMPSKSCGREYCLFLFNTSDLWVNTGIYLNEGDKYKMSVSGAFHSSAGHLCIDAKENNPNPDVNWIGGRKRLDYYATTKKTTQQQQKKPYCIAPDSIAYLGAIIYRIAPEHQLWTLDTTSQKYYIWNPTIGEDFQIVKSSGVLSMAINDIYFKDTTCLREYITEFPIRFDSLLCIDSIMKHDMGKGDYKKMFYNDNLGQILVCLEIQHPLPGGFFNPLTAFRKLDTQIELKAERTKGHIGLLFRAIPNFLVFILHISGLFILYILTTVVAVWLLFMFGYWFYKILQIPLKKIKFLSEKKNYT